ncbi:MAG: hypothetical protein ACYC6I_09555 [Bacillota bacterium]
MKNLVGQSRPLVSFEQIIPSNYGLNSLGDRLILSPGGQERISGMARRVIKELQT